MRRTIHTIAAAVAAVICFAVPGTSVTRAATWNAQVVDEPLENDDAAPVVIVDQDPSPSFAFEDDAAGSFSWTTEATLTPPPYVSATEADIVAPIASSTAIPLPPAAWTGLASLSALGAVSYLRRLKRRR